MFTVAVALVPLVAREWLRARFGQVSLTGSMSHVWTTVSGSCCFGLRNEEWAGQSSMTNRVRAERAILRITQQELARRVNVSRQTISSIEGGKYAPSTVLALKIAHTLGKTVEDLFALEESDWT